MSNMMNSKTQDTYETKITDAKWIAYDIPGNIGWILYIVFWVKLVRAGISASSVIAVFPAVLMLVGIVELISERMQKLDRVLPKVRLYRGFGALTLGGIMGTIVSLMGFTVGSNRACFMWMLAGSLLCAVFAGLLFLGYKKKDDNR